MRGGFRGRVMVELPIDATGQHEEKCDFIVNDKAEETYMEDDHQYIYATDKGLQHWQRQGSRDTTGARGLLLAP